MFSRFSTSQPSVRHITMMIAAVALLIGIILPVGSALADTVNIVNGSFEIDVENNGRPDGWKTKNFYGFITDGPLCQAGYFTDGACSLLMFGNGDNTIIKQDVLLSGVAGDDFVLTFDTMSEEASSAGNYRVTIKLKRNSGGNDTYKFDMPTGNNSWTNHNYPFEAESNYQRVRVQIQYSGNEGYVWWDNFNLTVNEP